MSDGTGELPFEASVDGGSPAERIGDRSAGPASDTFTVGELNRRVADALTDAFPAEVWVRGEIQDLHRATSGFVYFSLVDGGASADVDAGGGRSGLRGRRAESRISVVLGGRRRQLVNRLLVRAGNRVRMEDGTDVRIRGRVTVYEPRGQLQLEMSSIDPAFTLGQLAAARAALLAALETDGSLTRNAALPIEDLPLRVALVTAAGSAAAADALDELSRSGYAFTVTLVDVRVQGPEATTTIAAGLGSLDASTVDVALLCRGGGSATDLAAFDDEVVARAIADCGVPVVTGIGHDIDRSVADEVAAVAEKTPTAAAAHLVARVATAHDRSEQAWAAIGAATDRNLATAADAIERNRSRAAVAARAVTRSEVDRLASARSRAARGAARTLTNAGHGVDRLAGAVGDAAPDAIETATEHLAEIATATLRGVAERVDAAIHALGSTSARLSVSDPSRLLARGWAIVRDADGALLRSTSDVGAGDQMTIRLADGHVDATAAAIHPGARDDSGPTT